VDAAAALARNDRYIREFVEALHLCPYAKTCRESGKLQRRVLERQEDALPAMAEIEALPEDSVEVALLIFPYAPAGSEAAARAFESFCADLRPRLKAFYCVAFHPDLPRDLSDAHRAVQFIRRSPDPTIQMVRASVLRAVRGPDDGGTRVLDPSRMTLEQLMAVASPLSLADRIAEANLEVLRREDPDRVEALLTSFRGSSSSA
jgi:hypothetical protein